MQHKTFKSEFKAVDESAGIFEAIVSVFNNVDLVKDRVLHGAFAKSLKAWAQKGDPIPVIWSHQWDNPDAHIGVVLQAEENQKGLYIKGQLDLAEPFAAKVFKLMKERRVTESSFAYDIVNEKMTKDGVNELIELDLIEVGPTLKGANPATELIGAKDVAVFHKTAAGWEPATREEVSDTEAKSIVEFLTPIDVVSQQVTFTSNAPVEIKGGARHSSADMNAIQSAHDSLVKAGAQCASQAAAEEPKSDDGQDRIDDIPTPKSPLDLLLDLYALEVAN